MHGRWLWLCRSLPNYADCAEKWTSESPAGYRNIPRCVQGFASIDQHALIRKLGKLSDEQLAAIKNVIRELLGL
jgi:hypothetical protein